MRTWAHFLRACFRYISLFLILHRRQQWKGHLCNGLDRIGLCQRLLSSWSGGSGARRTSRIPSLQLSAAPGVSAKLGEHFQTFICNSKCPKLSLESGMPNWVSHCHGLEFNQEPLSILTAGSLWVETMDSSTFPKACIIQGVATACFWSSS